jgi:NADPH-dependent curcumin reductase CurA
MVVPRGEGLYRIDPALGRPSLAISALGMPGLTAWVGAIELGKPTPGDTVYISSAAGTIGQLAGQFAKQTGARVIGSVGSDDKLAFVVKHCGYDAAFNYKTRNMDEALQELAPNGIDVYLDNVGGTTLEAALRHANVGARFPICGMISRYNETTDTGIRGMQLMVSKRISMTGYIINDHYYDTLIAVFEDAIPKFEQTNHHWLYAIDVAWKVLQRRDTWYCFSPRIGKQRPSFSDCGNCYSDVDW